MSLKYYVTQKRCKEYIARTQPKFASKRAFEKEVKKLLEEYKDYPDNNINQKRFFSAKYFGFFSKTMDNFRMVLIKVHFVLQFLLIIVDPK